MRQLRDENRLKVSAVESYVTESEREVNVFVQFYEVLDGQEQSVECIFDHIDSQASASGHGNGVSINASESLLINRVLTNRWRDLLLALIPHEVVLQLWVHHEYWFQVMDVFPLLPLRENVDLWARVSGCDLGQLSLDVEAEATEILNVDRSASANMLVDVLDE